MSRDFARLYAALGRPSIPPERLLRAMLLQFLYAIRGEALLMEQLNYNLLFRWFVGLNPDDEVWHATVFSKNRDRLLAGDIAAFPGRGAAAGGAARLAQRRALHRGRHPD
jgi:transposase